MLIATTRERAIDDPGAMFSGERGNSDSFAAVTVSIPPDSNRQVGHVQWPSSVSGDLNRNFVTVAADLINDKATSNQALAAMAKLTGKSKARVFVHGFNNRFDDAVYRFAQIVHDARAEGIPVLFTWPSRGEMRVTAYTYDRESANYSRDSLENLIDTLSANASIREINIVAHSMGNWVTLEALRGRSLRGGKVGAKIRNVMLVAPDVDVDVFRTQIRRLGSPRPRIMLFVSQDDKALHVSRRIWGDKPRLGDVNPAQEPYRSLLEQENIAVFDLTKLGGDAHSRAFDDITQVMVMIREHTRDPSPSIVSRR
ncbi:MAG: alpha/beta fold hydrolase [Hyphomicrobiales bacterium]|nr:alpha/beta fold hydrolase [Hyphomicrobiales bacterium]